MVEQYLRQAGFLLDEGCSPQQVDKAMEAFGMAMGPFRMSDLAGNDIGWAIRKRRAIENPGMRYSPTADAVCELGRFEEADQRLAAAIAAAAGARDIYSIASAQIARCVLAIARADVATAIPPLEALLGAAKAAGVLVVSVFIESLLGRAKFIAGDVAEAVVLLTGRKKTGTISRAHLHGLNKVWLAEAICAQGMPAEADAILDRVEPDMLERGEAGNLAHCWQVRGKIALARADLGAAEAAFKRGLDQASVLWMRPVCDACEAGLAAVAAARGKTGLAAS